MSCYGILDELPSRDILTVSPTLDLNVHAGYNNPLANLITGAINRPRTPTPGSLGVNDTFMLGWQPHWNADLTPKDAYAQRYTVSAGSANPEPGTYQYTGFLPPLGTPNTTYDYVPTMAIDQTGLTEDNSFYE